MIERSLSAAGVADLQFERFDQLNIALARMATVTFDVVLTRFHDVSELPSYLIARLRAAPPNTLILPLPETDDSAVGARPIDTTWLADALHYIERRKQADAVLQAADEALFEEKERARVTLSSIGDAVLVTDSTCNVTYLNPIAETLTGWSSGDALGCALNEVFAIIDGETRALATNPAQKAMQTDAVVGLDANCVLCRRDGTESGIEDSAAPIHDRHGRVSGAVIVFRDVSQSRITTGRMAYLAQHNPLTDLANRVLFQERLDQTIHPARRHQRQLAVLFVDLDDFKRINDNVGHATRDRVLQEVVVLLKGCVRAADKVCRYGGDEFVILLLEVEHRDNASRVAPKWLAKFSEALLVNGHSLYLSLSVGISVFPEDGDSIEAIVQHNDRTMYREKSGSRLSSSVLGAAAGFRRTGRCCGPSPPIPD